MAYDHTQYEVILVQERIISASGSATTIHLGDMLLNVTTVTGVAMHWGPGVVPHIIKSVAVVLTDAFVTTATNAFSAGKARFSHGKNGLVTGTVTTIIDLDFPTVPGFGNVSGPQYVIAGRPTSQVILQPGEYLRFGMASAANIAQRGYAVAFVEPIWTPLETASTVFKATNSA